MTNNSNNTGKRNNYRGKKRYSNNKKFDRDDKSSQHISEPNDPNWYAASAQLLTDVASLPYSNVVGVPFEFHYSHDDPGKIMIPGIMTLEYTPTIGVSTSSTSPINTAARNVYTYVRHVNSGHTNYDAPDLMMYLMAMDSLYTWHAFLRRAYGIMSLYTPRNRYYPKSLVNAMHIDSDNIMDNMAQFRTTINTLAVKLGALVVPASMSYTARHIWMTSNFYMDGTTAKAQTYMMVPVTFWKYEEVYESSTYTGCRLVPISTYQLNGETDTPRMTLATIQSITNQLLNAVLGSEDMAIMSGDILKAYKGNIVIIPPTEENYTVLPQYSEEVLSQITNSQAVGFLISGANNYVTQNPSINEGAILFDPTFSYSVTGDPYHANSFRMINMHKDEITPADNMVATRLLPCQLGSPTEDGSGTKLSACGSEVVNAYVFYTISADPENPDLMRKTFQNYITDKRATSEARDLAFILSKFDWAPALYNSIYNTDLSKYYLRGS